MKNSDTNFYAIDRTQIKLSECIENEAEKELTDQELENLINKAIRKFNYSDSSRKNSHWRQFYVKFSKLAAAILIVLALSTTTVFAISLLKNIVPGKGLVNTTNGSYLILNEPKVIQNNGYEIEFINISYDEKYLDVKVRSTYIDKANGSYVLPQLFLYNSDDEHVEPVESAREFESETVIQKSRFIINNIDGCYFSFDKVYTNLDDTEKVVEYSIFTIPLNDFSLQPAKTVLDKSELGKFSTNNGISLLAYSNYIDNQQRINVIYASEKEGEELLGFGSGYKDNEKAITLSDKNGNEYYPINNTDVYGLYSSFIFNTPKEVLGEFNITDIMVSRQLNNQIEIPLPKENETIVYNKSLETSEGKYIVEKVERKADTTDNYLHLRIYLRNPVMKNNDVFCETYGHIIFASRKYFCFSPTYPDNTIVFNLDCNRNLVSEEKLTLFLDKVFVNVNGNWKLDVNKSEDVFKNEIKN